MHDVSRRKVLSWAATAPLAGVAAAATATIGSTGAELTQSDLARERIQKLHLPNVPLLTHEGKQVHFYDDLVKDKTQHIGNVRYGNEPLMLWAACPGMAHAEFVAESISWMLRPETNRTQAP